MQLATSMLFLLGALYGNAQPANLAGPAEKTPHTSFPSELAFANQPVTLETYVRLYYADTPVLAQIAKCESQFRHTGVGGAIIRGGTNKYDIGVMQINEFYHEDNAKARGMDLYTLEGNLAYAKFLYSKEGTTPWSSSSKCWQKSDSIVRADGKTANE